MTDKKLVARVLKNSIVLDQMHETLKTLDAKIDGLDHIIRGNGAPGLAAKVDAIKTRVEVIEGGRNRWRDACFAVGGGIVIGVAVFLFSAEWSAHYAQPNLPEMQPKP